MRRILLTWEMGSNLGHLSRLLPLAQRLKRRGHDVLIAARDPDVAVRTLAVETEGCCATIVRNGFPESRSARHDSELLAAAGYQAVNILRIAGENSVSRTGNQHDGRIDGIICTCLGEEHAHIAPHFFVDRTYIYRTQEFGNAGLLASRASPHLRDHYRAGAQFVTAELRDAQPRDH